MPRQALGLAAVRGHGERVDVPVVLRRERDGLAVRRDFREALDAFVRGETHGHPTPSSHGKQVARVDEDDAVTLDVRLSQEPALLERGPGRQADGPQCKDHGENDVGTVNARRGHGSRILLANRSDGA